MSDFRRLVDEAISRTMLRDAQAIEIALEQALVTGTHGVKVVRRGGWLVSAAPDPSVPYGQIHEHHQADRWEPGDV